MNWENSSLCERLTWAPFLDKVTSTEVVRVNGDGLLPNPELGTGLLVGNWVNLQLLPWNTWRRGLKKKQLYEVMNEVWVDVGGDSFSS